MDTNIERGLYRYLDKKSAIQKYLNEGILQNDTG